MTDETTAVPAVPAPISIRQAAAQGIQRLRLPIWANPLDHLKIVITDGTAGPWTHLFSPMNEALNGRDPVSVLFTSMNYNKEEWVPYEGPLPTSDEYKADAARYEGMSLKDRQQALVNDVSKIIGRRDDGNG